MAGSRVAIGSSPAFTFVLTMGGVNLFGALTYAGGARMNGQIMAELGGTAPIVSITAGRGQAALDETGATLGPLVIALVLFLHGDYRTGYALLLISCVLAAGALVVARINFPVPERLEEGQTAPASEFGRSYWLYMAAAACFAAGLMSYELIAYHLTTAKIVSENWIPG